MDHRLNVMSKTINFLKENVQEKLHQNLNFCSSKDTAKRVNRQATGWEKYWQIIHI